MKVAAALLLDDLLGEPPASLHPTVWMGKFIAAFEERAINIPSPLGRYLAGVVLAITLPGISFMAAHVLLSRVPQGIRWMLEPVLISTTLTMRGLGEAAMAVERELTARDLDKARRRVGEMVGRDTEDLCEGEVARAAVESVAENTSDGIIAPMLCGMLFGAPGALAYRAINTLDSMVGYRYPPYAELGWAPARLDDLANAIPARLTVLVVAAVSGRPKSVLEGAIRFGPLHSSPNAGWVEAAFAAALGLKLGGPNRYLGVLHGGAVLGEGDTPARGDIRRTVLIMRRVSTLFALAAIFREALRHG